MVKGIDLFQSYFERFSNHYAIIGGAAATEWFAKQELSFRATKDIDIVLLIEAIDDAFLQRFWEFVLAGGYEIKQRSDGRPIYYRFAKPLRNEFPEMLELFSRGQHGLSGSPSNQPLSSIAAMISFWKLYSLPFLPTNSVIRSLPGSHINFARSN